MMREKFEQQVQLLVQILPLIAQESCFALHGGTAINLFLRNLPRLSVDADLTYLPLAPRKESLAGIEEALLRIAERVEQVIPNSSSKAKKSPTDGAIFRIHISSGNTNVKIETSPVTRSHVLDIVHKPFSSIVQQKYGGKGAMPLLSYEEIYAGKLIAALDRQLPRDLFDVRILLDAEGIEPKLREMFVVYLINSGRPATKLLGLNPKKLNEVFVAQLNAMTDQACPVDELADTYHELLKTLVGDMPEQHKQFLIDFELNKADWSLLNMPDTHMERLPAVRWKTLKITKKTNAERKRMADTLAKILK